jgi:hypothetical protein
MVPIGSVGNTASWYVHMSLNKQHSVYFTQQMLTSVITVSKDFGEHCYTNTLAPYMENPNTIWIKT